MRRRCVQSGQRLETRGCNGAVLWCETLCITVKKLPCISKVSGQAGRCIGTITHLAAAVVLPNMDSFRVLKCVSGIHRKMERILLLEKREGIVLLLS